MNADNTGSESTPASGFSQDQTSYDIPKIQYNGILLSHDGTEKSDKALGHATCQSCRADPSALIATSNAKLEVTIYGGVKTMVEEKIRLCKQAGVKSQISYKIQTGKPL